MQPKALSSPDTWPLTELRSEPARAGSFLSCLQLRVLEADLVVMTRVQDQAAEMPVHQSPAV